MPAPKKPTTFDAHVGTIVNGLARPHGGRQFVADYLSLSLPTVARRMVGDIGFTVRELRLLAPALHTTTEAIVDQALRNYGDGDAEAGWNKLRAEVEPSIEPGDAQSVGGPHEDEFEYTPGGPKKSDHALAANRRPKKVDSAPYAE